MEKKNFENFIGIGGIGKTIPRPNPSKFDFSRETKAIQILTISIQIHTLIIGKKKWLFYMIIQNIFSILYFFLHAISNIILHL